MKILFVMPWKPGLGCIKKWLENLTKEMKILGHKTYILSPYKFPKPLDKIAIFLIYLPFIYDKLGILWESVMKSLIYLPLALPLALLNDFMISFYPPDSFILQLFFKLLGKKNVAVVHQTKGKRSSSTESLLWKIHYHLANGIIAISNSAKKDVEEMYEVDREKITTIYNGLDLNEFKNLKNELEIKGEPALLYVGKLERIKGPDILLEAFAIVKKSCKEAFLHILGDGSMRSELIEKAKKLGLENSVKFYGIIVPPYSYMKTADILIIPSRHDALPTVALEGMACGIPIVASDVGGLSEIILDGKNGLKARPEPEDIAKKIIFLWKNDELRDEISYKQREFIKSFTWKRAAAEYLNYMMNLAR